MRVWLAAALVLSLGQALDPGLHRSVANGAADVFAREYFDEAKGAAVAAEIRQRAASGRYAGAGTREALAGQLTKDFFELTQDKHVAVSLRRPPAPSSGVSPRRDVPTNAGFRRVEVLDGDIGLLDLAFFLRPIEHRDALAAAMKTLAPAKALVLDMRENGGGSPGTVTLLLSYLLDAPNQPLFEITHRNGTRDVYTTEPVPPADRDATRPVYVLTSRRSFSGGEGLPFILQELGRATVIGEPTPGAANPGRPYPIDDTFEILVSNGQLLTSKGQRSWEGTGVTPDVAAPAADALRIALDMARAAIKP